jgi:Mg-chelatase subunit ChlD
MASAASTAMACDLVPVTVTFDAQCPVCPGGLNAVFVLLEQLQQPGWQGSESQGVLDAVERYAEENKIDNVNLAVIHYNGQDARVVQQLTDDFDRVRGRLRTGNGYIPQGAVVPAANEAVRQIRQARDKSGGTESPCELVVMFAHVKSHDPHADELRRAGNIIKREVQTFLVGCPIDPGAWYCRVEPEMPRSRSYYAEYPENRLPQIARRDVENWESDVELDGLALEQSLAPGLQYVEGSASVVPAEVDLAGAATRLLWSWDLASSSVPPTITYSVKPLAAGSFTMTGSLELTDSLNRSAIAEPAGATILEVEGECEVPTPTFTPTATAVATETPVPPTATPEPEPIYIPIALSEACSDRVARSDVALVVDLSTSMNRPTRDGRTKLRATQDAVHVFVDLMDLGQDEVALDDRVAVVGFNRDAWIETGLTSDATAVHAAIERLPERQQEFTRLDLAFQRGAEALLATETRDPTRKMVLVVLTDGLPNQVPYAEDGSMETTVLRAANAAKSASIEVYTVGVGQPGDVNDDLLSECASDPEGFYRAEDAEDLGGIYSAIATTVLCPRGRHKWGEPWP